MKLSARVGIIACCALLLPAFAAIGATSRVRAVSYTLPEDAIASQELRALLLYLQPNILALHDVPAAAAAGSQSQLAALAGSLGMYYAYQPASSRRDPGCALLSRYPVQKVSPLPRSGSQSVTGMSVQVRVGMASLQVAVVRPNSDSARKAAVDIVSRLVKQEPKQHLLLMASFDPGMVMDTVKGWGQAGLQDAAVALKDAQATFPADRPTQRLDFVLVSANLRPSLKEMRVVRNRAARALGGHLPVELTFVY